ncbi:MAG: hypothetical protein ACJ8F7_04115 [Gemmataceae bacterium]
MLDTKGSWGKPLDGKLKDILDFLAARYKIEIAVDSQLFTKNEVSALEQTKVSTLKMDGLFVDTMLREILRQANVVYEIRGQTVVVVPTGRDGKLRTFPALTEKQLQAQRELRLRVAKLEVPLERMFEGDLKDILEFISDRFEVPILVDAPSFKEAAKGDVRTARIKLGLGKQPVPKVLDALMQQIEGRYQIQSDHIRIVPLDKSKS